MSFIDTTKTPQWRLQTSKRGKGLYYQAVIGTGSSRRCVTLGYLTPEEAEAAITALRSEKGAKLASTQPPVSDDGIRSWASEVAGEVILTEMVANQARVSGDFAKMPLKVFVDEVFTPVRAKEIKASTLRNDSFQWNKICRVIGSVPLNKITGMIVEKLLAHYADDSASARRQLTVTLRSALKYAVDTGIIKELPKMRPVKGGSARVGPRPQALSQDEVVAILKEAPSPMHVALWGYAIGQGVRPGEAIKLDWSDVNWTAGTVTIRGTKTAKSLRTAPLTPATREVLTPFWLSLGSPTSGLAFAGKGGVPPKNWSWGFKQAAKRAGVEKKVKAYTCRHTFATTCAMSGVPLPAAREMLGHSTHSRTLEEVYSNPDSSMLANAVKGLTKLGG